MKKKGGYAFNKDSIKGIAKKAEANGSKIIQVLKLLVLKEEVIVKQLQE